MPTLNQEQISALIQFIEQAEDPGVITNDIVAAVLNWLYDKANDLPNKTDKDPITGALTYSQSPAIVLKSMGETLDGKPLVTAPIGLIYDEATKHIQKRANVNGETITDDLGAPVSAIVYCNAYTGKLYRWTGSAWSQVGGSSGSDAQTQRNVDLIQGKFDSLIDALANYAFVNGKTEAMKIGELSWEDSGSQDDPTPTLTPSLSSPASGTTVNVGTNTGSGVSKVIAVRGSNLTEPLAVAVTGTGFSVSSSSLTAADVNLGASVTVTYTGTDPAATGTLTISSSEVEVTVNLTASYSVVVTPALISPDANTTNIDVGNISAGGSAVSKDILVQGENLTGDLTLAITSGTGFSVSHPTITPAQAAAGVDVTITYTNNTTPSTLLTATGELTISGGGITPRTIDLTASKESDSVTPEPVGEYYDDGHLELHLNGKALTNGATSWVDLIGDKAFTLQGGAAVHLNSDNEPDGVVFDGSSTSVAAVFSPANNVINFPAYIDGTIEIVFTPLTGFVSGGRPLFVTNNGDNTYDICAHWVKSVHGLCFVSSDNQSNKQYGTAVLNTFNDGEMQFVSATMPSHPLNDNNEVVTTGEGSSTTAVNWEYLIIHNGEKLTGHPTLSSSSSNKESGAGRLRLGSMLDNTLTDRCSPVIIHEVRVYDCHLTEEQMRANQTIDAARYGITLTNNS